MYTYTVLSLRMRLLRPIACNSRVRITSVLARTYLYIYFVHRYGDFPFSSLGCAMCFSCCDEYSLLFSIFYGSGRVILQQYSVVDHCSQKGGEVVPGDP